MKNRTKVSGKLMTGLLPNMMMRSHLDLPEQGVRIRAVQVLSGYEPSKMVSFCISVREKSLEIIKSPLDQIFDNKL
jgi:hypothetical protein